jgi:hypothetical protein
MLQEVELWKPKEEEKKEGKTTQDTIQVEEEEIEPDEISEGTLQEGNLSDNEK